MQKFSVFAAILLAAYSNTSLAQVDQNWSQRELERMQAEQERFNAQVERQRAEQERFEAQAARQRAEQNGATSSQSGRGCALCNVISIFDELSKKRRSKAVGRMLAAGDCSGAERYALSKGDFDLEAEIKDYCGRQAVRDPSLKAATQWQKIEADPDGTAYYVDTRSIHRAGDKYAWWMHVIYPTASDMRQVSVLSLFRCSDHQNAVKTFVAYRRDGNVQAQTFEDRDLKFEALDLKTDAEKGLVDEVCSNG